MNLLGTPKTSKWLCRLIPAVTWFLWLVEICRGGSHGALTTHDVPLTTTDCLFLISVFAYVPLVFLALPEFLFGGFSQSFARKVGYFIFAGATAGLGPVIWYFVSVDRVFRRIDKNPN